ncbi:MAG: PD-(D/E)XK nuclease family protein [Acidobacteriota bacterium]
MNIADILSTHLEDRPTREKIFFVPSFSIGRQIGEGLVRAGRNWINLRFVTTGTLADEIAGLTLVARGLRRLSGTRTRIFLHRSFDELRRAGKLPYFGRLELRPGLITAISHSLQDLRMAGLSSADLKAALFIDRRRGEELRLFLERYEDMLEVSGSFDGAGLLQEAVFLAPGYASKRDARYFCLETHILTEIEKDLITALAGDAVILVQRGHVTKTPPPRRLYFIKTKEKGPLDPQSDLERTAWLFALDDAPSPRKDGSLDMFRAVGEANECREVLRRIVEDGTALDDVEIIHPRGSDHPGILYQEARKRDLGMTFSEGVPAAYTGPGRVFAGLVDWIENDFASPLFRRMLEEETVKGIETADGERVGPQAVARIFRRAKIGWGRRRYMQRLDTLLKEAKERAGEKRDGVDGNRPDAYDPVRKISIVRDWAASFIESFPEPGDGGRLDLGALCVAVCRFLKANARVRDAWDGQALALLTSRLDDAAAAAGVCLERDDCLEWLRSLGTAVWVGASGPQPGRLHVSTLADGGYSGRSLTFVVGLNREAVPGGRLPDPLLLDEERAKISDRLDLSSDRLRENLYLVTALLSSLRGKALLSFSSYDVVEARPAFPSSILLQIHRLLKGNSGLDYTALLSSLPEPDGFIPDREALDETDWWLGRIVDEEGRFFDAAEAVLNVFTGIEWGDLARRLRNSSDLTAFDGYIGADEALDPSVEKTFTVSPSRLETLAGCPYAYFVRYVLGVRPPDDIDPDRGSWLDPMQRGSLLHDILHVFMKGLRDGKETLDEERHRPVLRGVAAKVIGRYREEIPPPSQAVFEREEAEIQNACEIFLRAESRRDETVEPLLFEVVFGRMGEGDEGIDHPVLVELDKGRSFPLQGRIDRVDRKADGTYRVIDYKTGGTGRYDRVKTFGGGICLQPVLYSLAVVDILRELGMDSDAVVSESGYAFPTRRGDGREILFRSASREDLKAVLGLLFRFLEEGVFPVPGNAICRWCDFAPVCGAEVTMWAAEKKEAHPDIYEIFDKLKEYK